MPITVRQMEKTCCLVLRIITSNSTGTFHKDDDADAQLVSMLLLLPQISVERISNDKKLRLNLFTVILQHTDHGGVYIYITTL